MSIRKREGERREGEGERGGEEGGREGERREGDLGEKKECQTVIYQTAFTS